MRKVWVETQGGHKYVSITEHAIWWDLQKELEKYHPLR
jgi:hypothetical protein